MSTFEEGITAIREFGKVAAEAYGRPVRPEPLRGNRHAPDGKRFPWGVIDETFEVGPYQIVKYRADRSTYGQESTWAEHGQVRYHPYIDGHDTSRCYLSLDAALVGVVAVCNEGPNTQADAYFMRMIGKGEA